MPSAFSSSTVTQADESGRFEVSFPEAGPANFLVATEVSQLVPIPFVLGEEREQEIDINVPSGQISGRLTQPGGGKLKRRMVKCSPEGRNPIHSLYLTRTTRCDSDGNFSFRYLPAGTYRVQIASVIDPNSIAEDVVLIADGHVQGLELQMGGTGKATVKVVDAEGKPVDGAFIFIQDARGNAHSTGSTRTTNGAGEIKLSKLGEGEYRFFASHGEFASKLSEVTRVSADTPATQTVQLAPGARATIQVFDGAEPTPARLRILNDAGHEFSRTMDRIDHPKYLREGHTSAKYDLGPLPAGKYLVRAKLLDGREAQGELLLTVGVPASLELRIDP